MAVRAVAAVTRLIEEIVAEMARSGMWQAGPAGPITGSVN